MSEYEHSLTIEAAPDEIFRFVADVSNLPKYLPTVHHAMSQGNERVRVQGEARGQAYDNDGFFRIDPRQRRMEWGSDGEQHYQGWLEVKPNGHAGADGQPGSEVTIHLTFEPLPEMAQKLAQQTGDHSRTIQQGLEQALASIKNICEGHGSKVAVS